MARCEFEAVTETTGAARVIRRQHKGLQDIDLERFPFRLGAVKPRAKARTKLMLRPIRPEPLHKSVADSTVAWE